MDEHDVQTEGTAKYDNSSLLKSAFPLLRRFLTCASGAQDKRGFI